MNTVGKKTTDFLSNRWNKKYRIKEEEKSEDDKEIVEVLQTDKWNVMAVENGTAANICLLNINWHHRRIFYDIWADQVP